jgi:hypothetical protein
MDGILNLPYIKKAFITIVIVIIFIVVLFYCGAFKPVEVTQTVVWDLQGLKKDFKERVYGQDEAVDKILQVIRDVVTSREANPRPNNKTIILVGGPGVGKHHVLNIIKNHLGCHPVNESATQSCELRLTKTYDSDMKNALKKYVLTLDTNGTRPMFAYFDSLNYQSGPYIYSVNGQTYIKNEIGVVNCYDDPLCFVTVPAMSYWSAESITSFADYEQYLSDKEWSVKQFASHYFHSSDIVLIKFKPLTRVHVLRCLREENFDVNLPLYDTDFVPLGCKALNNESSCIFKKYFNIS